MLRRLLNSHPGVGTPPGCCATKARAADEYDWSLTGKLTGTCPEATEATGQYGTAVSGRRMLRMTSD